MAPEPAPASSGAEQNFGASQTSEGEESLSPLEQEVLDEYARLLGNLNNVCIYTSSLFLLPSTKTLLASHLQSLLIPSSLPSTPSIHHPPPNPPNSLANTHQAIVPPPHPLQQPQRRDPRWPPRFRKENKFGVYVAQGECV